VTTTASPVSLVSQQTTCLIGDLEISRPSQRIGLRSSDHALPWPEAAERLKIPFYRMGLPMFDRLGAGILFRWDIAHAGSPFDLSNLIMADAEEHHEPTPDTWRTTGAYRLMRNSHIDALA